MHKFPPPPPLNKARYLALKHDQATIKPMKHNCLLEFAAVIEWCGEIIKSCHTDIALFDPR